MGSPTAVTLIAKYPTLVLLLPYYLWYCPYLQLYYYTNLCCVLYYVYLAFSGLLFALYSMLCKV